MTLDFISTRLENIQKRITEMENLVSKTEDKMVDLNDSIIMLKIIVLSLTKRAEDIKNRSHRDNIWVL